MRNFKSERFFYCLKLKTFGLLKVLKYIYKFLNILKNAHTSDSYATF